jgi:hypothetical protein
MQNSAIPRVPLRYQALVRLALEDKLPRRAFLGNGKFTENFNRFVLGGLAAWAFGDVDEGKRRLELAWECQRHDP